MSYKDLIVGWHEKASEGDFFSRFVFEYLAFIAHLKNNLIAEEMSDRAAIQKLKQDVMRREQYTKHVVSDKSLLEMWEQLIKELKGAPLHNSSHDLDNQEIDKWWNCSGYEPLKNDTSPKGIVRAVDDWENIVEFWHGVRNNLFHGGKNPNIQRDRFLVEHAYKTLSAFMDEEVRILSGI